MSILIMESIQIHLNSKFASRYVNDSISNCEFYLPTVEVPPQHNIYISVVSASIPYTFYNVDSNNCYLEYTIFSPTPTQGTVLIYDGNYNAYQLAKFIQTHLPANLSITYDSVSNKFTMTHTQYEFQLNNASTCLDLLGFKNTDSQNKNRSIGWQLMSNYCVNLQTKHCICIQTNFETGNRNFSNLLMTNILASVPVSGNPYSMIVYKNPNNYRANLFTNIIRYINVKLVDQNNNLINLNGCHFTITLQIDIENFT